MVATRSSGVNAGTRDAGEARLPAYLKRHSKLIKSIRYKRGG